MIEKLKRLKATVLTYMIGGRGWNIDRACSEQLALLKSSETDRSRVLNIESVFSTPYRPIQLLVGIAC